MDIIELAKEAGFKGCLDGEHDAVCDFDDIKRFAALVRAEVLAEPDIEEMTLTQIASRHEPVKQEPVGEMIDKNGYKGAAWYCEPPITGTQLYAAPVKREWVDLTDDEINKLIQAWHKSDDGLFDYASAVIAAFKAKQGENNV